VRAESVSISIERQPIDEFNPSINRKAICLQVGLKLSKSLGLFPADSLILPNDFYIDQIHHRDISA